MRDDTLIDTTFECKSRVICVKDLLTTIPSLIEGDALTNEYNSIPKTQLFSWNVARQPYNKIRNRYANLLPYDWSRVILKKESPNDSDYINANYVDGYKKTNRYIAMQGPTSATIVDFWKCLWQNRVNQVVMLTNLQESGKVK